MAVLKPFHGLLPRAKDAASIVSLPFDRYTPQDLERLKAEAPDCYVQVILAQENLGENRRVIFEEMLKRGIFARDGQAGYYLYRQYNHSKVYTGIIGVVPAFGEEGAAQLKKHEDTLEVREAQLSTYLGQLNLNAEPVYLTYVAPEGEKPPIQDVLSKAPDVQFAMEAFGTHELWRISQPQDVASIGQYFSQVSCFYIADGHHRMASSFRLAEARKAQGRSTGGDQYLLCAVFPEEEAGLLPFHRLLRGLDALEGEAFWKLWNRYFYVTQGLASFPPPQGELAMFVKEHWYVLRPKEVWGLLDIASEKLQNEVLGPDLGIEDPRKDNRLGFLGGDISQQSLEAKVKGGKWQVAIALPPVSHKQVRAIADRGDHMPPKSTWFEPKLLSGLVMLDLAEAL